MSEKYAVYVVVVEDTENADHYLATEVSSLNRVAGELTEGEAIAMMERIAVAG